MYLPPDASKRRIHEAQNARNNRAEIVRALGHGQITKRDLLKWGIFTSSGLILAKNGLSPYAPSAFAKGDSTGTPRSPVFGQAKFTQHFHRLMPRVSTPLRPTNPDGTTASTIGKGTYADFPSSMKEPSAKRLSYHTDFTEWQAKNPPSGVTGLPDKNNPYRNTLTNRGPMEGRPFGESFSHQRWTEYFPKVGYVSTLGQCQSGTYFHDNFPAQDPNAVWSYGPGQNAPALVPPQLLKLRYGEPVLHRVYNNLPTRREENFGFGRNESQLHFHNAHNGAESDGAANVHHFPGTFYDYRWSTTLARADTINTNATDRRASGPDGNGGLVKVPGDYRELQGSLWAHDHRFFFTAENVYKGNLMAVNLYSGPDRGNEELADGVNLRLPSGRRLDYGNTDFDVNLVCSDGATDAQGQYFFDIFTTDGFIGDLPLVNFAYAPVMEVLPRKYRFRILNASMSRFFKFAIAGPTGSAIPFRFIANDGNLVVSPLTLNVLDEQGTGERYDIVVDFSAFGVGQALHLVNLLQQTDGRKPDKAVSMAEALSGTNVDPCCAAMMRFVVVDKIESSDVPGQFNTIANSCGSNDISQVPQRLTDQIPIVAPVRTRTVEFGRGNGDSRAGGKGACTPDCADPEVVQKFPWIIKVNGQASHSFNANQISSLIPKPGEVEHWTYINGGGGWDHPIHLHFEEGVTINRGKDRIPATEKLARKDVWRLRPSGDVTFQVQFGEFAGSYVAHCHNTVHEDFAMLMRIQVFGGERTTITSTPNPTADGVYFTTPEVLPEADPKNTKYFGKGTAAPAATTTTTPTTPTTPTTTTPAAATTPSGVVSQKG